MNVNGTELNSVPTGNVVSGGRHLCARRIDGAPELLESSYRLRYQVYCLERHFLRAEDYPAGLEIDQFDRHSIHVGAFDAAGDLAGTARLVQVSDGLPLFRHCTIFPHETRFHEANSQLVEVSRLSVSRHYRRRWTDPHGDISPASSGAPRRFCGAERRGHRADALLTLLKALYQETKRIGATHWVAAIEKSLQRLLVQHGFPARLIGPEADYFGPVAPYQMDLKEFDQVILSGRFPILDDFAGGLEPELRPQPDRCDQIETGAESQPAASPAGAR